MQPELVLATFSGIGLLDEAFEQEGFCIVKGPDLLWGGDIRRFTPPSGVFGGVIGGPPCQSFSRLRYLVEANGYQTAPNLIPEFERVVAAAAPPWFLMENVPQAPEPCVLGYGVTSILFNNRWAPEAPEQNRLRRFSFGLRGGRATLRPETCVFENPVWEPAVLAHGGDVYPVRLGGSGKPKASRAAALGRQTRPYWEHSKRMQGLPDDFDLPGFTVAEKIRAVNNGVPLPMGRAIARAVRRALNLPLLSDEASA